MQKVYFAGPLFCQAEREFNARVTAMLEDEGYDVFLPQRDSGDIGELNLKEQEGYDSDEDVMQYIFEVDREGVLEADLVTTVLDGRVPSEGTVIEAAIAHEHDIPVIALKTGRRVFAEGEPYNAMVWGVIDEEVESPDELVEAVNRRLSN
ncbi:nucleoside 2-deoxyribosyltransferase [Natrinema halophilum]|uniref:Nucleoside 2-deoxyribosyltransferase domain-containing protein n=1 Tax=Natrinema halophilum TaxID=1699371 RepID=A0A7D5GIN1_9EURY|nr:nucleoside 2-deoxyribosyltransferase [Natrinema halophilum]QLG49827.1 nucleoside 2-deoxyribosyltransferase domain-containing protein [Natrinema halophilum]